MVGKSITLLFPGQGGQYVGMGRKLPKDFQHYFIRANKQLDMDLHALCLEGPAEELNLTTNTQPAILTYSMALWEQLRSLLEEYGISVARVLGHSVGEYAALVCANAIDFEDAVQSVHLRGRFMQEAVPVGQGGMVAVLKVDMDLVATICQKVNDLNRYGVVDVANCNAVDQVVISGHLSAMDEVIKDLQQQVGRSLRAVPIACKCAIS